VRYALKSLKGRIKDRKRISNLSSTFSYDTVSAVIVTAAKFRLILIALKGDDKCPAIRLYLLLNERLELEIEYSTSPMDSTITVKDVKSNGMLNERR